MEVNVFSQYAIVLLSIAGGEVELNISPSFDTNSKKLLEWLLPLFCLLGPREVIPAAGVHFFSPADDSQEDILLSSW